MRSFDSVLTVMHPRLSGVNIDLFGAVAPNYLFCVRMPVESIIYYLEALLA